MPGPFLLRRARNAFLLRPAARSRTASRCPTAPANWSCARAKPRRCCSATLDHNEMVGALPRYVRGRASPPGPRGPAGVLSRTARDDSPRIDSCDGDADRGGAAGAAEGERVRCAAPAASQRQEEERAREQRARSRKERPPESIWRFRFSICSARSFSSRWGRRSTGTTRTPQEFWRDLELYEMLSAREPSHAAAHARTPLRGRSSIAWRCCSTLR